MTGTPATGFLPATLLVTLLLLVTTAQTTGSGHVLTAGAFQTSIPATCTSLASYLGEDPPPTETSVLDTALNNALDELISSVTVSPGQNSRGFITTFCDFVISTQIPSATPSATSSLSSYISAAGIWLQDHGMEEAESLLDGECSDAVDIDDHQAQADLDFVLAFGRCYKVLGWDKRTSAGSGSATGTTASTATTTEASFASAATLSPSRSGSAQATPSQTGQATETDAPPPNAGSKRVINTFWVLGVTMYLAFLLS